MSLCNPLVLRQKAGSLNVGCLICALSLRATAWCRDAKRMEEMASQLSDPSELTPTTDGNEIQKLLGSIAERAKEDKFLYTKFFAIGLFRLLELTGKAMLVYVGA